MNVVLRKLLWGLLLLGLTAVFAGCGSGQEEVEIHVPTAASITDAMEDLIEMYESENDHVEIIPTYGSSGQLKDQINQGAPADVFLSAALSWVEALDDEGAVVEYEETMVNELVLVTGDHFEGQVSGLEDLTDDSVESVAIGDPETVPAGEYARQALEAEGVYDELQDKLILASDVREVLTYTETGNVDAGLVYQTDAYTTDGVTIVGVVETDDPVIYPIALLEDSDDPDEARAFYEWLHTDEALDVFESYGFEVQ